MMHVLFDTCVWQQWLLLTGLPNNVCIAYTARNATDLLQVVEFVNFTNLQQLCENQTCCKLIFAELLQVPETTCVKHVDKNTEYKHTAVTVPLLAKNMAATYVHSICIRICIRNETNTSPMYLLYDKKSQLSTCIKPRLFDNLQQTCYHQAEGTEAVKYQACNGLCNLCLSGCVQQYNNLICMRMLC